MGTTRAANIVGEAVIDVYSFTGSDQLIAQVALGIDGIIAQSVFELLAQLTDVTFNDAFFNFFIKEAVDSIEYQ